MCTEKIYWIAVDSDASLDEMESIVNAIKDRFGEGSGHIVSTKEVEPMTREEREEYVKQLVEALKNE